MLKAVDHLVIAVRDLEKASDDYRDLGFSVVPGGRHPGVGTYNALIAFADTSYFELIGFYEPRDDHRWWTPLQRGGGLVDYHAALPFYVVTGFCAVSFLLARGICRRVYPAAAERAGSAADD